MTVIIGAEKDSLITNFEPEINFKV